MMSEERRRAATSYIIFGLILFLIGAFDYRISHLIRDFNDDIRIYGWGWIPQLIGGLLAIYGIMTFFDVYKTDKKLPSPPDAPPSYLKLSQFLMDKETKKLIWLLLIISLVIYILLSPVPLCYSIYFIFFIMFVVVIIFRLLTYELFLRQLWIIGRGIEEMKSPYKSPPTPPKNGKIKSCKRCHRYLQPNWVVCPFCGESISDKN